jgi:hypothetical protein
MTMRGGNGAAGQWGNKMKRLFASAALVAVIIASPALGQSREKTGQALALLKIAPAMCGTSSSDVASVTSVFAMIAKMKGWRIDDLVGIRDKYLSQDEFNLSDPRHCETVNSLVEISRKFSATIALHELNQETETAQSSPTPEQEQKVSPSRAEMPIAEIKAKCVGEWPGDYEMQNYCIDKQVEAWTKVEQF